MSKAHTDTARAANSENCNQVFVYGTLRAGESNHALLATQRYLGPWQTCAGYTLYDTGPYPAAVAGGQTRLVGEVYAVDARCFARLDLLEDYPRSYTRTLITTDYGDAWIYLWIAPIQPHWEPLQGDWCQRTDGLNL